MKTSEILDLSADIIQQRGWAQGSWGPKAGSPVCLEGGIVAALGFDIKETIISPGHMALLRACPAYRAVQEYLRRDVEDELWLWNDADERTEAEVIEVLRAAAAVERVKEEKEATVSV